MAEYTLQYPLEIINGPQYIVKAQHLIANFNALNSAILDRASKTTTIAQTMQSALTINGLLTLPNGFGNNPTLPSNPTMPFQVATKQYVDNATGAPVGTRHLSGIPTYTSPTSFTMSVLDETNLTGTASQASTVTVSTTHTGLNGLDTGTVGANQYWYLYAIAQPGGANPGAILSQTNELMGGTITVPTGYLGGVKVQMPFAVVTDGSNNLRQWVISWGWPNMPFVSYTQEYLVLSGGTQQTLTPFTIFTPTIAAMSVFYYSMTFSAPGNTGDTVVNNSNGFTGGVRHLGYATTSQEFTKEDFYFHSQPLTTPNTMYYKVGGFNESLTIQQEGFIVDLVP